MESKYKDKLFAIVEKIYDSYFSGEQKDFCKCDW